MTFRRRQGGFTLAEVMIALGIVAVMLGAFVTIAARSVRAANRAKALTIATELARGKMYDIEEELLKNGFQETAETMEGDFGEEGYRAFTWEALIEKVEMPQMGDLTAAAGQQDLTGADRGANDPMGGGTGALDPTQAVGGGMIDMIMPVLENSIRKVSLTVKWKVGAAEESFVVVCYFTDPKAIDAIGSLLGGLQ